MANNNGDIEKQKPSESSPDNTEKTMERSKPVMLPVDPSILQMVSQMDDPEVTNSVHSGFTRETSKSGTMETSKSVMVPLDPSVLKMVSQMDDPEANEHDDDEYHEDHRPRCCRNYHLVCWCLCDIRRLGIGLGVLHAILSIFFIVMILEPEAMGLPDEYDDDNFQERIDTMTSGTIPRGIIGFVMAVVGSVGAYRFRKWPVLAMAVWSGICLLWAIVGGRYFGGIFAMLLMYTYIALFLALHHKRLAPENYATESRCCSLGHKKQAS